MTENKRFTDDGELNNGFNDLKLVNGIIQKTLKIQRVYMNC